MPELNQQISALIRQIEQQRNSKVLVLAASQLDLTLLPTLYNELLRMGPVAQLDVLVQSRGGEVNASRRLAMLLRSFCQRLTFLVPYYCQSAATLLVLAGDDIIAGELAMFSPIDPHLHGSADNNSATALSCQDIQQFGVMAEQWFGLAPEQASQQLLGLLSEQMFPPTLTAFYRVSAEVQQIAEQLLCWQLPEQSAAERSAIARQLITGYHSHFYALSSAEMQALGLKVQRQPHIELCSWQLSLLLQQQIGGAARESLEQGWFDAALYSADVLQRRWHQPDGLAALWQQEYPA